MAVSGRITEAKLWRERDHGVSPDHRLVPVVYYLSRNGQLEHPHFMEVPLSSPQGLFLRDVIGRLNVLRGKGMATMYSWSCKRSYKNGFVWHDLSENDFIHPAHANEYVLKGSELLDNNALVQSQSPPPENRIAAKPLSDRDRRRRNQSCSSIEYDQINEYSVYKAEPSCRSYAADAATQTDDGRRRRRREIIVEEEKKSKETHRDEIEISPPPSDSSPETLETLLKADGRSMQTVNKESALQLLDSSTSSGSQQIQRATTKSSSVLMQLISCGSLSFRDCGAGQVVSQYRMRVPRGGDGGGGRVKLEEKEYFSGSIVETTKEELPRLKRCSSYNADR